MAEHGPHCPFLNRADDRCSNHFSIDRLRMLFQECFGEYKTCPVYAELLAERQTRRAQGDRHSRLSHDQRIVQLSVGAAEDASRRGSVLPATPRF